MKSETYESAIEIGRAPKPVTSCPAVSGPIGRASWAGRGLFARVLVIPRAALIAVALIAVGCISTVQSTSTPVPPKSTEGVASKVAAQPTLPPSPMPAPKPAVDEKAVAEFYRGKTLRLVVSAPPGGSVDAHARAIARHLGKHLPGAPNVIVENMPGAGGVIAANHLYNVAPKDGSVIGHFLGTVLSQQLFGARGIEFDGIRFGYLGAPVGDTTILLLASRAGVTSFQDILGPNAKQVVLGGTGAGTLLEDSAKLARDVLGANIKLVSGYQGTAPLRLAVESGEIDGFFTSWESAKFGDAARLQSGEWIIAVQFADPPHPELPRIASTLDVAKTEEQRQLIRFGVSIPGRFGRPFVAPPGIPQDRLLALRQAFAQTMSDPEFIADAEKAQLTLSPISGDELHQLIAEYFNMAAAVKTKLQTILASTT